MWSDLVVHFLESERQMMRRVRILVMMAFFILAEQSWAGTCQPTWAYLSTKPLSVDSGTYTVKFTAILIGCAKNLETLKSVEIGKVQVALKRFLGERSLDLVGAAETRELRQGAVEAMNRALGRQALADIFFSYLSVGEAM
jgi:hypothetical protein